MILEFDLGNTSAKWRRLDAAGKRLGGGRLASLDDAELAALLPHCAGVQRVRVASVAAEPAERALASWVSAGLGVAAEFAQTSARCAGVTNSYREPQRMGVDRWLAMLAAYDRYRRALVVVDVGSALTIDLLDDDGRHRGGYIIPGARLMQRGLLSDTGRVCFEEELADGSLQPGTSTAEAVQRGIRLALSGAIHQGLAIARDLIGEAAPVFVTGGDSDLVDTALADIAPEQVIRMPDLVMDGLALALP